MNPLSSELPFHVHNWLIISLQDFCIVIRKCPTFWSSTFFPEIREQCKFQFTSVCGHVMSLAFNSRYNNSSPKELFENILRLMRFGMYLERILIKNCYFDVEIIIIVI